MLSHAANFYPDRFLSYSFLATGYSTPAPEGYDVDGIIAYTKQLFGYSTIGYFKFFNVSEAGPIIDKHQLSFAELYTTKWLAMEGVAWSRRCCKNLGQHQQDGSSCELYHWSGKTLHSALPRCLRRS